MKPIQDDLVFLPDDPTGVPRGMPGYSIRLNTDPDVKRGLSDEMVVAMDEAVAYHVAKDESEGELIPTGIIHLTGERVFSPGPPEIGPTPEDVQTALRKATERWGLGGTYDDVQFAAAITTGNPFRAGLKSLFADGAKIVDVTVDFPRDLLLPDDPTEEVSPCYIVDAAP